MGRPLSIKRVRRGKRFIYLKHGEPVDDVSVRRIERLAIPPAWNHVEIAASRSAKVLARGVDAAGRTQYLYHPHFRAGQEREKFRRLSEFGAGLPAFRDKLAHDLRQPGLSSNRVVACVLTLIDQELFRVGSPRYADEHETYGVTTLQKEHLSLTSSRAVLQFPGKSQSEFHRTIRDARLVRVLTMLADLPGDSLFQYVVDDATTAQVIRPVTAESVNATVKAHFGETHTVKTFRTWGATTLAVQLLATPRSDDALDHEAAVRNVVREVVSRLENTPTVAREAYIDPRVNEAFDDPEHRVSLCRRFARLNPRNGLTAAERLTLLIYEDM